MSVTWLKPEKMEEWWKQKWQPWMLKGKGKRSYAWVDDGIEMDTVQVISHATPPPSPCLGAGRITDI